MVTRLDNWPILFSAYLAERRKMAFEWGKNDCLAFAAKGVEAVTGTDFYQHYSDYHDEATANKMLEKHDGAEGIISACLGHSGSREVQKASRGDVVIAKLPHITAGLVDDSGQHIVFISPAHGLVRLPINRAWRYWSY
jgi:hypothetical protein